MSGRDAHSIPSDVVPRRTLWYPPICSIKIWFMHRQCYVYLHINLIEHAVELLCRIIQQPRFSELTLHNPDADHPPHPLLLIHVGGEPLTQACGYTDRT